MIHWRSQSEEQIAKLIKDQHGRLEQRRKIYEPLWLLIIKLYRPRHRSLLDTDKAGQQFGARIYDANPALTAAKFSRALFGHMSSRNVKDPWWLRFTTAHQELMESDEIKTALQNAEEQVRFGFNQSNFFNQGGQIIHEAGTIGTAVCIPKQNDLKDCMTFETQHPRSNFIEVNQFGDVDVYQRPVTLTAKTALEMFDKEVLPEELVRNAEEKNPFAEYEFLHAVYPNLDARDGGLDTMDKPHLSIYTICSGAKPGTGRGDMIQMKGVDYFPIVLRFGVEAGAVYGISPAADAMTAALIGNKLGQKHLQAVHAMVEPPVLAHENLQDRLHINPGGKTFTSDMERENAAFMLNNHNWQPSEYQMKKIDAAVQEIFGMPLFEMLTRQFADGSYGDITAYQVRQMVAEKLPQVVPLIEAAEDDLLEPATNVIWADEDRKGRMPEMPAELTDKASAAYQRSRRIINEYIGRLAQLRRTVDEANATDQALLTLKALADLYPTALMKIKELQFIERALLTIGIPQKDLHSDDEVQEMIEAANRKQEAAEQLETAERLGRAMPGFAKAVEQNSPAAMAMEAA